MRGQITRLMDLAGLPNVTLSVIPLGGWDRMLAVVPMHGFLIVDDTTYVELQASDDFFPPRETEQYWKDFDALLAEAVTGDEAVAFVREVARSLT